MTLQTKATMRLDELIGARLKGVVKEQEGKGVGFGLRLRRFIGRPWDKQAVYEAIVGRRKIRVSELVAFARATGRPAHYFLDARSIPGVRAVEVGPDADTIGADELRDLFRTPEPRDMSRDIKVALDMIAAEIDDLTGHARRLEEAARLINGTYWTEPDHIEEDEA
jgi:hypothetical protein